MCLYDSILYEEADTFISHIILNMHCNSHIFKIKYDSVYSNYSEECRIKLFSIFFERIHKFGFRIDEFYHPVFQNSRIVLSMDTIIIKPKPKPSIDKSSLYRLFLDIKDTYEKSFGDNGLSKSNIEDPLEPMNCPEIRSATFKAPNHTRTTIGIGEEVEVRVKIVVVPQ